MSFLPKSFKNVYYTEIKFHSTYKLDDLRKTRTKKKITFWFKNGIITQMCQLFQPTKHNKKRIKYFLEQNLIFYHHTATSQAHRHISLSLYLSIHHNHFITSFCINSSISESQNKIVKVDSTEKN